MQYQVPGTIYRLDFRTGRTVVNKLCATCTSLILTGMVWYSHSSGMVYMGGMNCCSVLGVIRLRRVMTTCVLCGVVVSTCTVPAVYSRLVYVRMVK